MSAEKKYKVTFREPNRRKGGTYFSIVNEATAKAYEKKMENNPRSLAIKVEELKSDIPLEALPALMQEIVAKDKAAAMQNKPAEKKKAPVEKPKKGNEPVVELT